ncbi:uncharacterized, partial [Tachysurus ichikawai]
EEEVNSLAEQRKCRKPLDVSGASERLPSKSSADSVGPFRDLLKGLENNQQSETFQSQRENTQGAEGVLLYTYSFNTSHAFPPSVSLPVDRQ